MKSKLEIAVAALLDAWAARAGKAHPADAMLINKHARELRETVAALAPTVQDAEPAQGVPDHAALIKLCAQLDGMKRTMFLRPGTGQNYSYLVREDVTAYVEQARAAAYPAFHHPDDSAVDRFAVAMKAKMAAARAKGRSGWDNEALCPAERLQAMLCDHVAKGDPVDVGNFAMMLFNRGERAATQPARERSLILEEAAQACDQEADGKSPSYRSGCLNCADVLRDMRDTTPTASTPPAPVEPIDTSGERVENQAGNVQVAAPAPSEPAPQGVPGLRKAQELLPKLHSLFNRLRNPSNIRVKCEEDSRTIGDASELCRTIINACAVAPAPAATSGGEAVAFGYFYVDSLDIPYPGSGFSRTKPKDGLYETVTPLYLAPPPLPATDAAKSPDANIEKNRELLLQRSIVGLKKYGVTTAESPISHKEWLEHALLEALDMANYLQAALNRPDVATDAASVLDPVVGDILPPIGERVEIHLARQDEWVEHTVVGYYAWPAKDKDADCPRLFVRVVDDKGYENARILSDIRALISKETGK